MREKFYNYLVEAGYREYTDKGRKSTVYSYCNRIDLICELEGLSWEEMPNMIAAILPKYDVGGIYEEFGKKSNYTAINALRAFAEFCRKK